VLIARGIKKIENRPWVPGRRLQEGARFAIHAGKKWDDRCLLKAEQLGVPKDVFDGQREISSVIVAVVTFAGIVTSSHDLWWMGPFGWLLEEPIPLPRPVPCRGAQGLWSLPSSVEKEVMAQC